MIKTYTDQFCVWSVDFHSLQTIIVIGTDECLIKGYDYINDNLLFSLKGHTDYLRRVQCH